MHRRNEDILFYFSRNCRAFLILTSVHLYSHVKSNYFIYANCESYTISWIGWIAVFHNQRSETIVNLRYQRLTLQLLEWQIFQKMSLPYISLCKNCTWKLCQLSDYFVFTLWPLKVNYLLFKAYRASFAGGWYCYWVSWCVYRAEKMS